MDAGFDSVDKVTRLRLLNVINSLNKDYVVFNGTYNSIL
jgi:hypothetical protein